MLKDYDCQILYHPGKANMVADALSRKSMGSLAHVTVTRRDMIREFKGALDTGVQLEISETPALIAQFQVRPHLIDEITAAQEQDSHIAKLKTDMPPGFSVENRALRQGDRIYVPDINELRQRILKESHHSCYSVHPGITKMYHDVKSQYWWPGMKKDVADFVSSRLTCQQVKFEH